MTATEPTQRTDPETITTMPNKPKTPVTGFRIPEAVKGPAVERAAAEGKTLTDVVVEHLAKYGKGKPNASKEGTN
jgi:hypothetical protein